MRIAIASDHAALALKAALVDHLRGAGHEVNDLGPHDESSVDYPDYGYKLAEAVASGAATRGVALCGSGIGISIAVNRNPAAAPRWFPNHCRPNWRANIMTRMSLRWARG